MLRTRKTYAMLDQAKGGAGSSQFGGMQALSAEHLSALSSVHIDPCFLDREKAIITANAVIAQQTAAIAAAGDPSKTDGKGKGKGLGKGKGKFKGSGKGKGKGKGSGSGSSTVQFVIPRDENGKVNGWVVGMQPCWCKASGLDDGQHIFDHCKYDENGKLKTAKVAATAASTTADVDQIAVIAAAAKKFMERPSADATSETTQHTKSAVVTPPEDIDTLMSDDAMSEQLRQFYALNTEEKSAATKVKSIISNMITIFICSLVVLTVIAAVVAGLHWAACAVPSSATLSQMNSAHLEVPISHYEAFPWVTWILHKATEKVALIWQYYNLWLGYIFYFVKVNARITFAIFSIYSLRRDLIRSGSHVLHVLHSAIRPLRSHSAGAERTHNRSLGYRTRFLG